MYFLAVCTLVACLALTACFYPHVLVFLSLVEIWTTNWEHNNLKKKKKKIEHIKSYSGSIFDARCI